MLPVLLVQLPVPSNPSTNVPLAGGYLKAYAYQQGLLDRVTVDMLPRDLADHGGDALIVAAIVARRPALLGVSLYTWNSERSLAIVLRVKERLPTVTVVVGGPEVQRDNAWILQHPAVDVAVVGEGEQTFADLLRLAADRWEAGRVSLLPHDQLATIAGVIFRDAVGALIVAPERVELSDLSVVPSPYVLGYLEVPPDSMLMVEVSRWCPYACSFCLYGRNMGVRLGNRYFSLERLLDEIRWGREQGATRVHFIEANLNLVPIFWPLVTALADLNADGQLALYAELRGEHLSDDMVDALARAGLRVAEVGLQTANPVALRAAHRRTDLQKWAAGTRRLLSKGVEVYLDVILGLPADDEAGVEMTLDFIQAESLGSYDIFTLQVLPGTAVRNAAAHHGLQFQSRPPYYILGTDRLPYTTLRRLRRELKHGAELDPDVVEGCPAPRGDALVVRPLDDHTVSQMWLADARAVSAQDHRVLERLAAHVDVVAYWDDRAQRAILNDLLAAAIHTNPATIFDCYLLVESAPDPAMVRLWRDALPYTPGYLDRVAVYRRASPVPEHDRISPRLWLVIPWTIEVDPERYRDIAEVIWMYDMGDDTEPPLQSWIIAGGAGVWVRDRPAVAVERWRSHTSLLLWDGVARISTDHGESMEM